MVGVGTLAVATLGLVSPAAYAAAPDNDDWDSATQVDTSALPFEDSVDTTDATMDAVNPTGLGHYKAHSIWYSIVPEADGQILFATAGTNYSHKVKLYHADSATQAPDEWTAMQGTRGRGRYTRAVIAGVQDGEQYYLVIGGYNRDDGGTAKLLVREPAHVSFKMTGAAVDPVDGSAVLHGAVRSDQPVKLYAGMTLRQLHGKRVVSGSANERLEVTPGDVGHWMLRFSDKRPFRPGEARLDGQLRIYDAGARLPMHHALPHEVVLK